MIELFLALFGLALAIYGPQIIRADTVPPWPVGMQDALCRGCVAVGVLIAALALVSLAFWQRESWRR